ncbi:hypothetical protein GCM10023322_78000 [Rugosimonospora acidiphila]|uniref:DUF3122 domain-containing protein n=1 Tax=Rugosimonospora acidiphila TaxID=556531 RepID=A0ABP9STB3_9ACTN
MRPPAEPTPDIAPRPEPAPTSASTAPAAQRLRRWPVLLVVLLALALPAAALLVLNPQWIHGSGSGGLPDRLRISLAQRAVVMLESSPQIEHLGHDEDNAGPRRVMCTLDPFGVDPPAATTVAQVRWVYALHLCVIGQDGTPWDYATKSAGPVAIGLGNPPAVRLPVPQLDYRTQVRQLIPARYQSQAFGSFAHPQLVAQLRQRYIAQVASAPTR